MNATFWLCPEMPFESNKESTAFRFRTVTVSIKYMLKMYEIQTCLLPDFLACSLKCKGTQVFTFLKKPCSLK